MNTRRFTRFRLTLLLATSAAIPMLLSACQPVIVSTTFPPEPPAASAPPTQFPTATQALTETLAAVPSHTPFLATATVANPSAGITFDLSGIAQDQVLETVPAVLYRAGSPWWEPAPEYRRISLHGYPVASHALKPQIFIYRIADLASANENMGKAAVDLQTLLQTHQAGDQLPCLPLLTSSKQIIQAQMQYLEFKSGKGVRFLTQSGNGIAPINNADLVYTFQGLTSNRKYYVSAVLPVTHPGLPASSKLTEEMITAIQKDQGYYLNYLAETVAALNQQPDGNFAPDLARLDALVQSIEVK